MKSQIERLDLQDQQVIVAILCFQNMLCATGLVLPWSKRLAPGDHSVIPTRILLELPSGMDTPKLYGRTQVHDGLYGRLKVTAGGECLALPGADRPGAFVPAAPILDVSDQSQLWQNQGDVRPRARPFTVTFTGCAPDNHW